ncbi:hypothetical protein ONZ45_g9697 [Pleurotus djamor]|nr:hypothetical protein ONZ45_g9697 [Pleurotus djamor]
MFAAIAEGAILITPRNVDHNSTVLSRYRHPTIIEIPDSESDDDASTAHPPLSGPSHQPSPIHPPIPPCDSYTAPPTYTEYDSDSRREHDHAAVRTVARDALNLPPRLPFRAYNLPIGYDYRRPPSRHTGPILARHATVAGPLVIRVSTSLHHRVGTVEQGEADMERAIRRGQAAIIFIP